MSRYLFIPLFILLFSGCTLREKKPTVIPPVDVRTMRVEQRSSLTTRHYVGTIEEEARVPMSVLAAGNITDIPVRNGQHVCAGDVLLILDGMQAKNMLATAQATLRQAEDGYRRAKRLHEEGVVTDVKEIEIETQLAEARSAMSAARKALDDCTMRAPLDGIVTDIAVHRGQNLVPGQRAMTLVSEGGFKVVFHVPESEIADIRYGDLGTMEVKAVRRAGIPVSITEKSMLADRISHSYEVKAIIDSVGGLMPGMVCRVELQRDAVSGFLVPQHCVRIRPDGPSVWVIEHHAAVRRAVTTGGYAGDDVLITSGLRSGDYVVVEGAQKLYNGCGVAE